MPIGYRLVCGLARLLVSVFYRGIEVVGLERVPAAGPVILAANHQNALVDPMLLLVAVPRRLHPLAKAPLFRHPFIGPFLRLAGAIPVHRRQDEGSDPTRNQEMFRVAAWTLADGGAILIFPEGVSQAEPVLQPLRTGAARVLLAAEAAGSGCAGVTLLPVGLRFDEPGTFRAGRALVAVGEPVATADCVLRYRTDPEPAVRALTERLAAGLRGLIVEAGDRRMLRLFEVAEAVWREEAGVSASDAATRAAWLQRATRAYRYLHGREAARLEALEQRVARYAGDLERAGFTGAQLAQPYTGRIVRRYAMRQGASLLLGLPVALWGLVNHGIPYRATGIVVRRLRPEPDVEATYKVSVALVLYPVCWVAQGWTAWWLGGPWLLGAYLVSLAPTGFFALTWWERLARVRREARGFLQFLRDRDLRGHLRARRRALMAELTALASAVPEPVLAGRSDPVRSDASRPDG